MRTVRRTRSLEAAVLVSVALLAARGGSAQAFATVYSFEGGNDGANPDGLVFGKNGAHSWVWRRIPTDAASDDGWGVDRDQPA
jgi:hypothetical protein